MENDQKHKLILFFCTQVTLPEGFNNLFLFICFQNDLSPFIRVLNILTFVAVFNVIILCYHFRIHFTDVLFT